MKYDGCFFWLFWLFRFSFVAKFVTLQARVDFFFGYLFLFWFSLVPKFVTLQAIVFFFGGIIIIIIIIFWCPLVAKYVTLQAIVFFSPPEFFFSFWLSLVAKFIIMQPSFFFRISFTFPVFFGSEICYTASQWLFFFRISDFEFHFLLSKFGYLIQKHKEYAKEYSPFHVPPPQPHSREISQQKRRKKKSFCQPHGFFNFLGAKFYTPASGLGEMSTM